MMMSLRFHHLLLAILLWTEGCRVAGGESAVANESLPQHFHWGPKEPYAITLFWDATKLGTHYAEQIDLEAKFPESDSSVRKMVNLPVGKASVGGLSANTPYEVIVRAYANGTIRVISNGTVVTSSEDRPASTTTMHSSASEGEMSTYVGTEEGVVTTSRSAFNWAISAIIFTCVAIVLA
ncbi:Oncosphere antigen B [Taenia solium]|eukprot:TsM_000885400 transcript=TsM_000885400 gene=TsM_000885400